MISIEDIDATLDQVRASVWRLEVPIPLDWQYAFWVEQDEEDEDG